MVDCKILQHDLCIGPTVPPEWRRSKRNLSFSQWILNLSSNRSFILWLQCIHDINIFRKPSFPINPSLIFTLIVQTNLSLVQQIFVDSVIFIVHICNIKNKHIYQYSLMKENQVASVVNVILSKFGICKFWKIEIE